MWAKKFGLSFETQGSQTFWRDIPGLSEKIRCTPKGTQRSKKGSEKVLGKGSQKGSRRGPAMGFTVKRVLRRVLGRGFEKGVSRRCLERPLEEYAPLGVRPRKVREKSLCSILVPY